METLAIMIILVPILTARGSRPQHRPHAFRHRPAVNLVIGQITPPVGILLFVAGSISKTPLGSVVREVWPYVAVLIGVLFVLTYVPGAFAVVAGGAASRLRGPCVTLLSGESTASHG